MFDLQDTTLTRIVENAVTVAKTLSTKYLTLCSEMELQETRLTASIEGVRDLEQRNQLLHGLLDHALALAVRPDDMPHLEAQEVPTSDSILRDEAYDVAGTVQTAVFVRAISGTPPSSDFVTAMSRPSFAPPYDYRTFAVDNIAPESTADEIKRFVLYFGMMRSAKVYERKQEAASEWYAVVQMTNSASALALMMVLTKQARLAKETFAYRRVVSVPEGTLQASDKYLLGEPVYVQVEHAEKGRYAFYPAYVHHVRNQKDYEVLSIYGLQRVRVDQLRMRPDDQFQSVVISPPGATPTVTLLRNVANRTVLVRIGVVPTLWSIRYLLWSFAHQIHYVKTSRPNEKKEFLLKVITHSQADRDALLANCKDIFPDYYKTQTVLPDRLGRAPTTWNFTGRRVAGRVLWKSHKRPSIGGPFAPGQDNVRTFARPGLLASMTHNLVREFQRPRRTGLVAKTGCASSTTRLTM